MQFSEFFEHEVCHCCCGAGGADEVVVLVTFEVRGGEWAFKAGAEDGDHARRGTVFEEGEEVGEEALAGVELQGEVCFDSFGCVCHVLF